MNVQH